MGILDKFILLFEAQVKQTGFTKLNKNLQSATKQMKATKLQAQSLFGARGMFSTKDMLRGFIGFDIYSALRDLPQQFIDASVRLGAMRSRFNAVADSAQESGEQLKWVSDQSRRLGLDLYNTADNYSIFYATVKKTLGGDVAQDIFGQWTEAFRVLHIPQEQQSRVLYALREMSSKGKIYMQDLAMQLGSAVPSAMPIASQAMGYGNDIQRFREDITAGKINANQFLKAFSKAVHTAYVSGDALAKAMQSPDAQIQRMQANWQYLMLQFAEAGVSDALVSGLQKVNDLLDFAGDHAKELYQILSGLLKILLFIGGIKVIGGIVKWTIKLFAWSKGLVAQVSKLAWLFKFVAKRMTMIGLQSQVTKFAISTLLKSVLNFIPYIGTIVFTLWTIYDIVQTFFPNAVDDLFYKIHHWINITRVALSNMIPPEVQRFLGIAIKGLSPATALPQWGVQKVREQIEQTARKRAISEQYGRNPAQTVSVKIGDINVETRATDAEGTAKALSNSLGGILTKSISATNLGYTPNVPKYKTAPRVDTSITNIP